MFGGSVPFHFNLLWHCFTFFFFTFSLISLFHFNSFLHKGPLLSEWSFFGFPEGGSLGNLIHTHREGIWSNFFPKKMLKALLLQPFKVLACIPIFSSWLNQVIAASVLIIADNQNWENYWKSDTGLSWSLVKVSSRGGWPPMHPTMHCNASLHLHFVLRTLWPLRQCGWHLEFQIE